MDLKAIVRKRYTTKKYNPSKKIPADLFEQLIDALQYTPTSINSQPYHFIIAETPNGKSRIAKSMEGDMYSYNHSKVIDASHVVVICAKTDMDKAYIQNILDQEEQDGRIASPEKKQKTVDLYSRYIHMHKEIFHDLQTWMDKQAYIALGTLLLGAATLGIDATPIEGFDHKILDNEFNLHDQGYKSLVTIALGYRADDDYNAELPKSRLPKEQIFSFF
ncbi:oxygen-insensitive NAD(P)H nitroreductase [Commensalibacter oyaizuii]|uniref:Oxygen-insensitive NAD(P)H nitroreductase n=1 Tax=Commensalibacter oyaizuii TaxID=3043873 RepID=A0ABT6Q3Q2_9PROT|nr:oxygen-insensitive NAD(P)H nitroreductase [Commensalibacter sp. TBRC 16381]MDI2091760.1 oxygen-insensitive NAD(P)H nitroreductase [Commensalibacter sp. TBRC 16381]